MSEAKFYFESSYLKLSTLERFIARLFAYLTYATLISLLILFILSQMQALNAIALILLLFFLDRSFHFRSSRRSLAKASHKKKTVFVNKNEKGAENIIKYFKPRTLKILETAQSRALMLGGDIHLHLLLLLLRQRNIRLALKRLEIPAEKLITKTEEHLDKGKVFRAKQKQTLKAVKNIAQISFSKARKHYDDSVGPNDLMAAFTDLGSDAIERLFILFNIKDRDLESALILSRRKAKDTSSFLSRSYKVKHRTMNRAWTARPTPTLDRFSVDLTDAARAGKQGFLIGHEKEYDRLVDLLSRSTNPNVILTGDPGVGKSSVIKHLALQIINDRVPKALFDKRLVSLEIANVVAGAQNEEGELEGKFQTIIEEIRAAGNIILCLPNIHELLKTGGTMRMSAADLILPEIQKGYFPVIGSTYPREYKKYIENNSAFRSSFETVKVEELSPDEAALLLSYKSLMLEQRKKTIISFSAIKKAVNLAHKYFRQKLLPGSAEDLLKESLADAVEKDKDVLRAADVVEVAEKRINIPLESASEEESNKLLNLEDVIHEQYINQDEAVKAVSSAMREYRSGLSNTEGPIANFLFIGPTGVGKTELSKILAEIQFGSRKTMHRFDMSEYQSKESISKLIGSKDSEFAGSLSDAVRSQPYSLVLLDEFEKAHPDILNIFLQVLDDGRLTDAMGRNVDFSNTIIIATSNAHSNLIKEELEKGGSMSFITEELKRRLTEYFKPELVNRFSKIVVFQSLSWQSTLEIAKLHINKLIKDLEQKQAITLEISESAIQAVATLGFDEVYGARPLKRVISEQIRSLLADKILKKEVQRGQSWKISYQDDNFHLELKN